MSVKINGKVHEIGQVVQITDSFKKRDLVIEDASNPQYPEFIKLELHQDNTSKADSLSVGDEIEADVNIKGRPWTNKEGVTTYFNSLVAWRVSKGQSAPQQAHTPPPVDVNQGNEDDGQDLPF